MCLSLALGPYVVFSGNLNPHLLPSALPIRLCARFPSDRFDYFDCSQVIHSLVSGDLGYLTLVIPELYVSLKGSRGIVFNPLAPEPVPQAQLPNEVPPLLRGKREASLRPGFMIRLSQCITTNI